MHVYNRIKTDGLLTTASQKDWSWMGTDQKETKKEMHSVAVSSGQEPCTGQAKWSWDLTIQVIIENHRE